MIKPIIFKTSMKFAGCIAAVAPGLDALKEVRSWKANINGVEKTLNVESEETAVTKVVAVLEKAGFRAERIFLNLW